MELAGIAEGLDAGAARKLAIGTCLGAARLAAQSDSSPSELREQVTSKGGTTAAALDSMRQDGFDETVQRAVHAARVRGAQYG